MTVSKLDKDVILNELVNSHIRHRNIAGVRLLIVVALGGFIALLASRFRPLSDYPENLVLIFSALVVITIVVMGVAAGRFAFRLLKSKWLIDNYRLMSQSIQRAEESLSLDLLMSVVTEANAMADKNPLVHALLEGKRASLDNQIIDLKKNQLKNQLRSEFSAVMREYKEKIKDYKQKTPLMVAMATVVSSIQFLEKRREELKNEWAAAYEKFSWWNKLKYGDEPDLSKLDQMIDELKAFDQQFDEKYQKDFEALDAHFSAIEDKAVARVLTARDETARYIEECGHKEGLDSDLLKKAIWLAALSVPVSVWDDVGRAGDIYETLRGVNGNFVGLSDTEIWWESLFLSSESFVGLASLTKGAYFEQLVAADTGGKLFEHFNHPDTDIVIDGVAHQIKATSSEAYIHTVDDEIPVIATSEVALNAGVIDSGYSDQDLNDAVELALGGAVVDVGDTSIDALLTGVGSLGFFATVEGINHALKVYENGGDEVEALFEGAGVAIEGTARAAMGAAELSYNVITSRPSRLVGRVLYKGFVKLIS